MKYFIVYSSRFPINSPPKYYLDLAKAFSSSYPTVVLDVSGHSYPKTEYLRLGAKLRSLNNIFFPSKLEIYSTSTRLIKFAFLARQALLKLLGYKVVFIKNFVEPSEGDILVKYDVSVFDCTDHFYSDEFSENAGELKKFDIVLTNFNKMKSVLQKHHHNVVLTPTGYLKHPIFLRLPKVPNSVVFSGGISRRIDFDLLLQVIKSLPGINFFFIGEVYLNKYYMYVQDDSELIKKWENIISRPNVTYLGKVSAWTAAASLSLFNIGIIPYYILIMID